jgi:SAM-dependent methyltransferase
MLRFDIINYLISVNGYKSFLEIGTQAKINFTSVSVDRKVCVDPDPNAEADYLLTSDEYFENNFEKFDIVFVDGLHHADVAYRDIVNSLRILNPGGCVVVHDVIPYSYEAQVIPLQKASDLGTTPWNGDVWKSWVKLRTERTDLFMSCINTDHGCGIIHFTNPGEGNFLDDFQNGYYNYNRDNIMNNLNLISPDDFLKKYSKRLLKI